MATSFYSKSSVLYQRMVRTMPSKFELFGADPSSDKKKLDFESDTDKNLHRFILDRLCCEQKWRFTRQKHLK